MVRRSKTAWNRVGYHYLERSNTPSKSATRLDKAHRRGVTHRDLKPANVMLTKSGVKLLDFGAATSGASPDGIDSDVPRDDASQGPTAEGMILGTLQYMSPEQLEGKQADRRTDIFAFGAVVYEIITGKKALRAASPAGLISAILRDDAQPIADLVPQIPPPLAQAIARCLSKDPDERWQTASDLLFQLRCIASASPTVESKQSRPRRLTIERAAWTAAVLASIFITLVWARSRDVRPGDPAPITTAIRFNVVPAEGNALYSGYGVPFALSPNGRQIVYVADNAAGTRQLWLRSLYSEPEQPLPGTEGANTPFWSPDSQWIGFFADNSLKKVRISSGLTQVIASNVATYGGAAWNAGDVIVFARAGRLVTSIRTGRSGLPGNERRREPPLAAVSGRRRTLHLRGGCPREPLHRFPRKRGAEDPDEIPSADFFTGLRTRVRVLRSRRCVVRKSL